MKRIINKILLLSTLAILLCGCTKTIKETKTVARENSIIVDYSSSKSLLKALDNNIDVNNKVAKVLVKEVLDSTSSLTEFKTTNNLIFKTNTEINISSGYYIILKINASPIKENEEYIITFDNIKIIENKNNINDNIKEETSKITLDKSSKDYITLDKSKVETELKSKGFTNIELKGNKTNDKKNLNNSIISITINDKEFNKEDRFDKGDKIIINYWLYEEKKSEYDIAFIRKFKEYSLYYMFDTTNKKVIYFATNSASIDKGIYSGDFNTGVTIEWTHGEWKEKFIYKDNSKTATLIDGNNFDWEYTKCDVIDGEKALSYLPE